MRPGGPAAARARAAPPRGPRPAAAPLTAPLPRTPETLADDVAEACAALPPRARVLLDGVGSHALAADLVPRLVAAGRPPVRVPADGFWRPAGERFEHGREDAEAFRTTWLDAGALHREVLASGDRVLPALRDPRTDRSSRAAPVDLPERAVVLVDGVLLLGRGLPADLVVHVALSPGALARRGVPDWQREAFADYERAARPREACSLLVLAEDPRRPALLVRDLP